MVAAFHKAVIQQSSGERPFATIYDQFYGDVTQQGIILDKLFAMQGWVGLWPGTTTTRTRPARTSRRTRTAADASYQSVAEDTVDSMIGGQYDVFPYFVPLAVALFAQDTHTPTFSGRIEVRNWIGGHVVLPRRGLPRVLPRHRDAEQLRVARRDGRLPGRLRHLHVRPAAALRPAQRVLRAGQAPVDLGLRPGPQQLGRRPEGGQHGLLHHRPQLHRRRRLPARRRRVPGRGVRRRAPDEVLPRLVQRVQLSDTPGKSTQEKNTLHAARLLG